jgi:hypothetical protein
MPLTVVTWACVGLAAAFPAYWLASGVGSYLLILLGWLAAAVGVACGLTAAEEAIDPRERVTARVGAFLAILAAAGSLPLVVFVALSLGGG